MRTSVVLEPETVPNSRGSICLSTAGFTERLTTISSDNLETIGVTKGSAKGACLHREQASDSGLG